MKVEPALPPVVARGAPLRMAGRRRIRRMGLIAGSAAGTSGFLLFLAAGHPILSLVTGAGALLVGLAIGQWAMEVLPELLPSYRREFARARELAGEIEGTLRGSAWEGRFTPDLEEVLDHHLVLCHEVSVLRVSSERALRKAETRGRVSFLNRALGHGKSLFDHFAGEAPLDGHNIRVNSYRVTLTRELDRLSDIRRRTRDPADRADLDRRLESIRDERDLFEARLTRIAAIDRTLDRIELSLEKLLLKSRRTRALEQDSGTSGATALLDEMHHDIDALEAALVELGAGPVRLEGDR